MDTPKIHQATEDSIDRLKDAADDIQHKVADLVDQEEDWIHTKGGEVQGRVEQWQQDHPDNPADHQSGEQGEEDHFSVTHSSELDDNPLEE